MQPDAVIKISQITCLFETERHGQNGHAYDGIGECDDGAKIRHLAGAGSITTYQYTLTFQNLR